MIYLKKYYWYILAALVLVAVAVYLSGKKCRGCNESTSAKVGMFENPNSSAIDNELKNKNRDQ